MFSRLPPLAQNINIAEQSDRDLILEVSKKKDDDLSTFFKFFKSGRELKYDYHQLTYLNEKPPGGVTIPMLKTMQKKIYEFKRENIIYCKYCNIYRKPGSHHCKRTGYCVSDLDEFSSIFCLAICKGNLPHFQSQQLWTFFNVVVKQFIYFYALFYTKEMKGLVWDVPRYFCLIIISFVLGIFIVLNLMKNQEIYCDNMYVIDYYFGTEELKDRLKSQGTNKLENFLYVTGIDKFSEQVWPRMKNNIFAGREYYDDENIDKIDEDSRVFYLQAFEKPENEGIVDTGSINMHLPNVGIDYSGNVDSDVM